MKITEAWTNRDETIKSCELNDPFGNMYEKLKRINNQIDFENILLANYSWCVVNNILDNWLPDDLPNCVHLRCYNNKLTSLSDLPECTRFQGFNNNLKTK